MKISFPCWAGLVALISVMAGCSTPQAALDQANNSATLTMSLQAELQNFRTVQANVAQARIEGIRRQTVQIAIYESESSFGDRVLAAAGKTEAAKLATTLKDLADSRIKDDQALTAKLAEINDILAKLLTALPDSSDKLIATQKALAVLGEELSAKERFELASKFAQSIKAAIDENKKKIEKAQEAAPTAGAQGAPKEAAK